jgi:hypothetical protein
VSVTASRQGIFPFVIEFGRQDDVTARAGLALVAEAVRAVGLDAAVEEHLSLRERRSGYSEAEKVEAVVLLQSAGGDCIEDIRLLSADLGFERMLGRELPSPDALHGFLASFHDPAKLVGRPADGAFIPEESDALKALAKVNTAVVRVAATSTRATLDLDATIIESHKREALWHYKSGLGYQPALVLWAEEQLVVADEFRDGNVPAGMQPLTAARRAFAALPPTVVEYAFRGDSACYEEHLLKWLMDPGRDGGPAGRIAFSISADMTEQLIAVCRHTSGWKLLEERTDESVEWTDVEFHPGNWNKTAEPVRYVALRFTKKQRELFEVTEVVKHLAVVTNRWEVGGGELVRWHWEKAGTIEHAHDVMKNELGAGTMPSKLFGANAAWYRLCGLTYNVLTFLKRRALPERFRRARPERLRFELFTMPARLAEPAGRLVVKPNAPATLAAELIEARGRLLAIFEGAAAAALH